MPRVEEEVGVLNFQVKVESSEFSYLLASITCCEIDIPYIYLGEGLVKRQMG